eukprot:m51a1_g3307 putative dual specificity protein phosphatase 8-like isoform x2 (323) ;mRNA; f:325133-326248
MSAITLSIVGPERVFNLPLFEMHAVIDVRSASVREARGFVDSSRPAPFLVGASDDPADTAVLTELLKDMLCFTPERFSPIVVYGSRGEDEVAIKCAEWLQRRITICKSQHMKVVPSSNHKRLRGPSAATVEDEKTHSELEWLLDRVVRSTTEIWVLQSGFEGMQEAYPVVCRSSSVEEMLPTPHHVVPELFVGSRFIQITKDLVEGLRVSHVITTADKDTSQIDRYASVTRFNVPDDGYFDMSAVWDACNQIIHEAQQRNQRAFVFLHGRSLSGTVAVAWLMHSRGLSFGDAVEKVRETSPRLVDTLLFTDQLSARHAKIAQ